jgi:shikimate kinase
MARKVLRIFPIEEYCVLLLVPPTKTYTAEVNMSRIKTLAKQADIAHKEALNGNYWSAMTLNGLIYSNALRLPVDVIIESLEAGALAAGISGKGPAYAFVVEQESEDQVLSVLKEREGEVRVSKTRRDASLPTLTLENRERG